MAHNIALGRRAGLTEEQIDALRGDWHSARCFTPAELAVLHWADRITRNTVRRAHPEFAELYRHFNPAEVVEITLAAANFNMLNRIKHALHIDVEAHDTIAGITGSLDMNLVALRDHLQFLLADVERRMAAWGQKAD